MSELKQLKSICEKEIIKLPPILNLKKIKPEPNLLFSPVELNAKKSKFCSGKSNLSIIVEDYNSDDLKEEDWESKGKESWKKKGKESWKKKKISPFKLNHDS